MKEKDEEEQETEEFRQEVRRIIAGVSGAIQRIQTLRGISKNSIEWEIGAMLHWIVTPWRGFEFAFLIMQVWNMIIDTVHFSSDNYLELTS